MLPLWLRSIASISYWKRNYRAFFNAAFSCLGAIWLVIRIVEEYWPAIQGYLPWWIFLLLPAAWTIWICRPISYVRKRVEGRDVEIEIRIGDIFNVNGSLVISTNSTFDTDMSNGLISENSLQGKFTKKYYDKEEYLDEDLKRELQTLEFKHLCDGRKKGNRKRYPIGTVAKLTAKNTTVYMVAVAHMNKHGTAEGTMSDIMDCLGKLWYFIGQRGEMEPIVVPVFGTGRTRIKERREYVIREIVESFIASCSEKKISEKLIVVVSRNDYIRHKIDLDELDRYLTHVCKYTRFRDKSETGSGRQAC